MIFMNLYISSVQDDGFADSRAYLSLKLKFVPQEPMVEAGGGSPVLRMEDFKKKELKELEFLPWGQGRWIQHDTARKFIWWLLCVCLKLRGIRDVLNGNGSDSEPAKVCPKRPCAFKVHGLKGFSTAKPWFQL